MKLKFCLIGCGSLGSAVLQMLLKQGESISEIALVDFDMIAP